MFKTISLYSSSDGLQDVIVYGTADNPKQRNRGFAFLEYESHKLASNAKRKLQTGHQKVWQCDVIVDWADPMEEPDDETMAKVSMLLLSDFSDSFLFLPSDFRISIFIQYF